MVVDMHFLFLNFGGSQFDTVDHADEFHILGFILRHLAIAEGIESRYRALLKPLPFQHPVCTSHRFERTVDSHID